MNKTERIFKMLKKLRDSGDLTIEATEILDEFEIMCQCSQPGVITGKPLHLGGSKGRSKATAQGGVYVLEELVKEKGLKREVRVLNILLFIKSVLWKVCQV